MPSEKLEKVKELLQEVLDLEPSKRSEFLDVHSDDSELRREIESLLTFEDTEQPWVEGPIVSLLDSAPGLRPDDQVGPYRIIRLLGEGGMGTVALAVREDDFEKKVALKVVSPHRVSRDLLQRFHNERQLLAQLEHPNIAPILDGGTTDDGYPYFVMEYVRGEPINLWCKREQPSIGQRLELLLQICSAIQLAHRNLIVHRDLKPSNILVTPEGRPVLLDFGIAKRLELGREDLTRLSRRPMTLRYASPEQISGQSITTAADIYSIGVLLYEVLTGSHPLGPDSESDLEVARAIREHEPRKPSAVVAGSAAQKRKLAGDLDSIVLKAMRKEPIRRYLSVEQLAEDIHRYLSGRVVLARKGTWSYRVSKFVRRNRWPLGATTAVVLLSLAFGVSATVLWRQAVIAEKEAAEEQRRSTYVLEFMKDIFRGGSPDGKKGYETTALELLDRGLSKIDYIDDPVSRAELLGTIGDIYAKLELYERADVSWSRAEELLRIRFREGHPKLAKAINNRASSFLYQGKYRRAEQLYREALAMKSSNDANLAKARSNLATSLLYLGDFEEAELLYRQALEERRQRLGPSHLAVAGTLHNLGTLYYITSDLSRAEPLLKEALAIREKKLGSDKKSVASTLASLGRLHHAMEDYPQAEALYLRAIQIRRQLKLVEGSTDFLIQLDLGRLYLDLGRLDAAEKRITQSLEGLSQAQPSRAWELALAKSVFGAYLCGNQRYGEAEHFLVDGHRELVETRGARSIYAAEARSWLEHFNRVRKLHQHAGPH